MYKICATVYYIFAEMNKIYTETDALMMITGKRNPIGESLCSRNFFKTFDSGRQRASYCKDTPNIYLFIMM